MNCEECRGYFGEHLYGELEESLVALLEEHLQGCQSCRAEFLKLRATRELLARWPDEDPHLQLTFVAAEERTLGRLFAPLRGWRRVGLALGFALAAILVVLAVSNTTLSYDHGSFTFSASLRPKQEPSVTPEAVIALQRATLAAMQEMVRLSEQQQHAEFTRILEDFARELDYRRQHDLALIAQGFQELHARTLTRMERTDRFLEELVRMASYEQALRR